MEGTSLDDRPFVFSKSPFDELLSIIQRKHIFEIFYPPDFWRKLDSCERSIQDLEESLIEWLAGSKLEMRIARDPWAVSRVLVVLLFMVVLIATIATVYFLMGTTMDSGNSTSGTSQVIELTSPGVSGYLRMSLDFPNTIIASPDLSWINYSVSFLAVAETPQSFSLTVNTPHELIGQFSERTLTVGTGEFNDTLQLGSSPNMLPGNYRIGISADSGGSNLSASLTVQVLKYLVVTIGTSFVPQNLTVVQGNSVTWLRLNGILSQSDDGSHDVDFSSGISTVSPTLAQFQSWSYNFTQTGNYSYYCKYHPFMTGDIIVISSS